MVILIHGAWHGAWVWRRLKTEAMRAPDLDLSADASLSSHAAAIGALIAQSGTPVLLVGHSYGAAVAQLAAARLPERTAGLIALDGFLLRPGQAVIDLVPPAIRDDWRAQGSMVRPLGVDVMAVKPADRDWVAARLKPHPLRSLTEPASGIPPYQGKRLYVRATGFAYPPFDRILARCRREGWGTATVASGHDIMLDEAAWLS